MLLMGKSQAKLQCGLDEADKNRLGMLRSELLLGAADYDVGMDTD